MVYIEVSQEVVDRLTTLMNEGRKVDSIRALREAAGGFGLKEYKDAVEQYFGCFDNYSPPSAQIRVVGNRYRIEEVTLTGPSGKVTIKGGSIHFQHGISEISLEEIQDVLSIWNRIRE
jgi:hypothetical protein